MSFNINEAGYFGGQVRFANAVLQDGAVGDDEVESGANLDATKLVHQHAIRYSQADGTDVAAAIVPIHIARAAATVVGIEVVCVDAPEGGDKGFTVDLLKANEGTPTPASILTGTISFAAGAKSDCEVVEGTISSATLADGDTLLVQTAVSGSTGNQGQGLVVIVTIRENPGA